MSQVACPHCGAMNAFSSAFCEACGKALPVGGAGPRIVEGGAMAATQAGRELQAQELAKKARSAAGALLAVAILTTLGAFLIPVLLDAEADKLRRQGYTIDQQKFDKIVMQSRIQLFVVAGVFYGLFFWARKNPFPPAIIGLVLYVSLWLISGLMDPQEFARGILVKLIIVTVLIKAIQAGAQYRKLQQEMAIGNA